MAIKPPGMGKLYMMEGPTTWLYADGVGMESGVRFERFVMHQLLAAQGKAHEVDRVLSPAKKRGQA